MDVMYVDVDLVSGALDLSLVRWNLVPMLRILALLCRMLALERWVSFCSNALELGPGALDLGTRAWRLVLAPVLWISSPMRGVFALVRWMFSVVCWIFVMVRWIFALLCCI